MITINAFIFILPVIAAAKQGPLSMTDIFLLLLNEGRRTCPSIESLQHGFTHGQQFWEGKHVSFTCNPGYCLKGSSERVCLEKGSWTGVQPSCILGKRHKFI